MNGRHVAAPQGAEAIQNPAYRLAGALRPKCVKPTNGLAHSQHALNPVVHTLNQGAAMPASADGTDGAKRSQPRSDRDFQRLRPRWASHDSNGAGIARP